MRRDSVYRCGDRLFARSLQGRGPSKLRRSGAETGSTPGRYRNLTRTDGSAFGVETGGLLGRYKFTNAPGTMNVSLETGCWPGH